MKINLAFDAHHRNHFVGDGWPEKNEQTLPFLTALGYGPGDRLHVRLIPPSAMTADEAADQGLGWRNKEGKAYKTSITGYLELRSDGQASFYKVRKGVASLASHRGWERLKKLNQRRGVYLVVNPGGESNAEITEARSIFYECDDISLPAQHEKLAELETALGAAIGPVVQTRKSLHVYVKTAEPISDLADWKKLQQRLIQRQSSDQSIFNPARLMRIPGFDHIAWKEGDYIRTPVRLLRSDGASLSREAIESALPAWDMLRWDKAAARAAERAKSTKAGRQAGSISTHAYTGPVDAAFDIRNFAQYLQGYAPGQSGWITARCPHHNGVSDNSLHINESSGAFICHGGCDTKDVYRAAVEVAKQNGHQFPAKKEQRKDLATAILSADKPLATRETTGRYLPKLSPLVKGAVNGIDAPMNAGKTVRIGADWIAPWVADGGVVVALSPLNSLGQQSAQAWGLPHIHDYFTDQASQSALRAHVSDAGGIVACPNSLHRVLAIIPSDRPLLLVIDEAAQTLADMARGGTLKKAYSDRWENFVDVAQAAIATGAIAMAEANLSADAIELVKNLSYADEVTTHRHKGEGQPWQCYRYTAPNQFREALLGRLQAGERIMVTSASEAETRRLAYWAESEGVDHEVISSRTNEAGRYRDFFANPDQWLAERKPQLLVVSPSAKTGVSIEGGVDAQNAYFSSVWGWFPALDTDTHFQLLGRYRPTVPRHFYCPAFIQPEAYEGPKAWGNVLSIEGEAEGFGKYVGTNAQKDPADEAIRLFLAERLARAWAQKTQAAKALSQALSDAGHTVDTIPSASKNSGIAELWDEIKMAIANEDAEIFASLQIDPARHTLAWASKADSAIDSTLLDRSLARKVRTIDRFPGLDWDCPELWFYAFFAPKNAVGKGAALWAESEFASELFKGDLREAEKVLSSRIRAAHLLPTAGLKAGLGHLFRPLLEKLATKGQITPSGGTEEEIKSLALRYRAEIKKYWRLVIKEDQSAESVAGKIARKFGFIVSRVRSLKVGGRKAWIQQIAVTKAWLALAEARNWALRGRTDLLKDTISKFVPAIIVDDAKLDRGGQSLPPEWQKSADPPDRLSA